jgi:hypothetical protein
MSTEAKNPFRTPLPLSSHPVDVGRRSEAAIAGELLRRGFEVLQPMSVNARYDLVVDFGDRFARVQCKTGRLRKGVVEFNTVSVRTNTQGWYRRGYEGEVEFFGVYCVATDAVYLVPIEDCPRGKGSLRVEPCRNAQASGVRWARDYELRPLET